MTTALRPGTTETFRAKHDSDSGEGISAAELLSRYAEAGFDRPTRASRRAASTAGQTVVTQDAPAGLDAPVGLIRGVTSETGSFGRNPRAVVATMGATMLGATAVMGVVAAVDSPATDEASDGQSTPIDLAGSDSATMKLSVPATRAGQAAPGGQSTAGSSIAKDFSQATGMVPAAFDQADAARIAANNLTAAKKASADQAAAAARSNDGGDDDGDGGSIMPDLSSLGGSGVGAQALAAAKTKLGMPYVWGADGPNAFDCSGLMTWAFEKAGKDLPRTSAAQSEVGEPVGKDELKPGDMVFFYDPVSHVGIYAGNGKVLHASTSGEPVKYSDIDAMPFHNATRM